MKRRVVMTGVGAVTPLGVGAGTLHECWLAGRLGLGNAEGACKEFEPTEFMSTKEARRSHRFVQLAIAGSALALAGAGWESAAPPCDPVSVGA